LFPDKSGVPTDARREERSEAEAFCKMANKLGSELEALGGFGNKTGSAGLDAAGSNATGAGEVEFDLNKSFFKSSVCRWASLLDAGGDEAFCAFLSKFNSGSPVF